MLNFDKNEIKEQITLENIFELLELFGAEPQYYNGDTIISLTIDHNDAHEGTRKLYYYEDNALFVSYTAMGDNTFDIYELVIKVFAIQRNQTINLNDAVRYVAFKLGISGTIILDEGINKLDDWDKFSAYDRIESIEIRDLNVKLKEYDQDILTIFDYDIQIGPWLKEGINQETMRKNHIGYFAGGNQITIPHYDINNRMIGVRGRTLSKEEAQLYGKYRPISVNGVTYQFPTGMNLYGINLAADAIGKTKTAIILEGEKSVLKMQQWGIENAVAVCGSNLTNYQINLLKDCGCTNIIIAFDRQWQQIGDKEYVKLTKNFEKINQKYGNTMDVSFVFDRKMVTGYKDSPVDNGYNTFMKLFSERVKI